MSPINATPDPARRAALPVVAIVGRPNVGKSTLFNALTQTRNVLVADLPGVTRDRQYGLARVGPRPCVLVDTGGLVSQAEGVDALTAEQVRQAVDESSLVLLLVSARDGLTAEDEEVAAAVRRQGRPVLLVVNKSEDLDRGQVIGEFAGLGFDGPVFTSSAHRHGLDSLMEAVAERLPGDEEPVAEEGETDWIRLAVVGRPNVGKSTLFNRLLGEERAMALDMPGTTRDAIHAFVERDGQRFELVDTAGIRRRARIDEPVEKFSTIKAMQAIEQAHVVVVLLDATEGVTDQDLKLLGHVLEQGRALVIAVNKWDGLESAHRREVMDELDRRLSFVPWARRVTVSALHGSGLGELMDAVLEAWRSATLEMSTPELTRVLREALEAHQPPVRQGYAARLRYAHGGGKLPPRIVIHGNRTDTIPPSYVRYLENTFIRHFKLRGTPLVLEFRGGDNPYKGRRNPLSERQQKRRKRMLRHAKRK
ncbi:MAG: ribosome biogenesis GTPase Der [Xanthomonadales bacterium]|nr:ribosome biogenesis GTPase Der [Xanthomonadales bacterium]